MLALKRRLIGTGLGRLAAGVRDCLELLRTPRRALGTVVYDQMAIPLLIHLTPDGETFVDVGAHIGSVIAEARRVRPRSQVIAFEAMPDKADFLRQRFPDAAVHCCALAEEDGEASFYVADQSGFSSLAKVSSNEIKVRKCRLDDVLGDRQNSRHEGRRGRRRPRSFAWGGQVGARDPSNHNVRERPGQCFWV